MRNDRSRVLLIPVLHVAHDAIFCALCILVFSLTTIRQLYFIQVGITRNSAASLCRGSPRLCNEYLLFRFPNLS